MLHLDYRDTRPIYVQIIDGVREQILSGILRQGDRLPSVRELAGQLAINPNTIQRAYRELESVGLIASIPGKGSYVSATGASHGIPAAMLEAFDAAAGALLRFGMTPEQLAARLTERGDHHA